MQRLSNRTLRHLATGIGRPRYDRAALATGIVHLGLGAFHRGHQAHYTEAVLNRGERAWGTAGVSLRAPATRDALEPQDGFYVLNARSAEAEAYQVIGGLTALMVAPENPRAVIALMAEQTTRIVSITVTEKGYCADIARGGLDADHPAIRADLTAGALPTSLPGLIVAALAERRRAGLRPFSVLSCDNLPENGRTTHRVLTEFGALLSPELGRWIGDEVACPQTMLDRIVPATRDEDRRRVAEAVGLADAWPVVAEAYTHWVVEDRFTLGRPDWDCTFVGDVAPHERMKIRLLNGAHSLIAYLGFLSGRETVAEAMADPALAHLVRHLMRREVLPTLAAPAGSDPEAYAAALFGRFANPALAHRTQQIAMDGSLKIPQRWLATITERLARDLPIDALALGLAGWMRYVMGTDEAGRPHTVNDPLAADLAARVARAGRDAGRLVEELFGVTRIFPPALAADLRLRDPVRQALARLLAEGSARTIERFRREHP